MPCHWNCWFFGVRGDFILNSETMFKEPFLNLGSMLLEPLCSLDGCVLYV